MLQQIDKPFVWQMVREAVEAIGGQVSYSQIRTYIQSKYADINDNTITCQTIACTVNHPSRIHYNPNRQPRLAVTDHDFLFTLGKGRVELYAPERHGEWKIEKDEYGGLKVVQAINDSSDVDLLAEEDDSEVSQVEQAMLFPLEKQLRDFIAGNIQAIAVNCEDLQLYVDDNGRDGVEYPTGVGPIDILAKDKYGNFVVFELKLRRGPDKALGQLLRYMGWIKQNLAQTSDVKGIIVAQSVDEKLRYAASIVPNVNLFEYELSFKVTPAGLA
ncbi:MAG: hypothetical protein Kow00121_40760 [Elainellaceae cyanobacterium]